MTRPAAQPDATGDALRRIECWFDGRGWSAFDFQRAAWAAYLTGDSGLIHAPTGTGKTQAAWFGPVAQWLADHPDGGGYTAKQPAPATVVWVTPLRALAGDTAQALQQTVADLALPWSVELRTGDVSASVRARQKQRLPTALITTPESLTLLLSYPDAAEKFATLRSVVVDEWHELMGTKRGVQTELALARLRTLSPGLRTWGLSATMGNLAEALSVLVGSAPPRPGRLVDGQRPKDIAVDTLIPDAIERFPWAGHIGVKMVDAVIDTIERARTTLLFCNTRSQAEIWYASIIKARPDLIGRVAIHHGSLDHKLRTDVEQMIRAGELLAAVCTSSLDLGVDFAPVEQVMQLGSPKGVARLMQRAGRSGHQPGKTSRIVGVPTHAFELIEFSAAREQVEHRRIEDRPPLDRPMDVLAQHLVTVAAGGGFRAHELLAEVRTTHAFTALSDEQWDWALRFVERGGKTLGAYPQYARIRVDERTGVWSVAGPQIARTHRLGVGTITGDTAMKVAYTSGRTLGTIEESFISRLRPGDRFVFSGRSLELVRVREMTAQVKKVNAVRGRIPRWGGSRFPLSTRLVDGVRARLHEAREGVYRDDEMRAIAPLLELQKRVSRIPDTDELLIERVRSREGHHRYLYPFVGRLAHEGLGALLAYRLTRLAPRSIAVNVNDYGIELLCHEPLDLTDAEWAQMLGEGDLLRDLLACLNESQMARRQFRGIARVAGLILPTFPGERRAARHVQASSDLFFDVFSEFDPDNMLLEQARREVLEEQLEVRRLTEAMQAIGAMKIVQVDTDRLSPMAFPLFADRLRQQQLSSEKWRQRIERMAADLEDAAAELDRPRRRGRKRTEAQS